MAAALLTLLPVNEHAAENSAKDQVALNRSTESQAPQTANPFGLNSLVDTRWDIYEIIFGMFLSLIGLALILLSLLRWKTVDLSLISFGALCFLYGARTKAFQFFFDIPLEKKIYEFREKGTVLGQFEDIQFKNITYTLQFGDRILLYTDEIVETSNSTHTLFGLDRFKEFIISHTALPAGQFADALIEQLLNWSGEPSGKSLDDDLTLIVADYQHV